MLSSETLRVSGTFSRFLRVTVWMATSAAIAIWAFLYVSSDANAVGMLLAFGPRHWLPFLWLPVLLVSAFLGRTTFAVSSIGALVTLFGIAGFELRIGSSEIPRAMRVVTYNTDGSRELPPRVRGAWASWQTDVALFQDCRNDLADSLRALRAAGFHATNGFCVVSRWPISSVDSARLTEGGGIRAMRYAVSTPRGSVTVYSVHLSSPRTALWDARNRSFGELQRSIVKRTTESQTLTRWVSRLDEAIIVAGDFNLPDGSRTLRAGWPDFIDAFQSVGSGFGHTMRAGRFTVRIDHALSRGVVVPVAIEIGSGYPSEHQPLIVDYGWRGAGR